MPRGSANENDEEDHIKYQAVVHEWQKLLDGLPVGPKLLLGTMGKYITDILKESVGRGSSEITLKYRMLNRP